MSTTSIPERLSVPERVPERVLQRAAEPSATAESAAAGGPAAGVVPAPSQPVPREIARHLVSGTSALGAGVLLERGLGFAANLLAARLGGAATFGAYSLAFTNASQISAYAGGGIGATAAWSK